MNIRTFVAILSQNPQYDFPKMRGGSKAVWNFSENSSVLETPSVPNDDDHNHDDDDVDVAHDDYDVDHDDDDQDHDLHIVGTVCDNMQHIKISAFPLYIIHGSTIQLGLQGPRDDDDVLINIISSVIAKLSFC